MLTIDEIHKIEKNRNDIKKEIYKKIYEQFSRKIKNSVQLGQKSVILTVPNFMVGYPTYDVQKAAKYLMRQLTNGGFNVTLMSDRDIHVSWAKKGKSTSEPEQTPEDQHDIPSLVNLKKLVSKHKRA